MNIYIVIKDRVAEVLSDRGRKPLLVCGNLDNRIVFTFDEEWLEKKEKVARFVYRTCNGHGSTVCCDVPIVGNSVIVPFFQNVSELWVGVIAEGEITTSATRIACIPSISGVPAEECEKGEAITVTDLSFENGDYIVNSKLGMPIYSVTIKKPSTLIPENIREGITIAGIVGNCSGLDENPPPAPVITLSGDILNVEYDSELTKFYCLVVDGQEYGAITATSSGSATLNLKNHLSGQVEVGTYMIAVKAYNGSAYSMSNEVSYTFDGTILDKDKAYFIGLGGKDIEITYKIGPVDLTDYVQYWDIMDPDGTVQTPNGIGGLYGNEYILLYLPEGVTVSGYSNCEIKTFDDPHFIQLYNFSEAFAIVNFASGNEENGEPDTSESTSFFVNGKMYSAPSGCTWYEWEHEIGGMPSEFEYDDVEDRMTYNGYPLREKLTGDVPSCSSPIGDMFYYAEGCEMFWCSKCELEVHEDEMEEDSYGYYVLCVDCVDTIDEEEDEEEVGGGTVESKYYVGISADKFLDIEYKIGSSDLSEYVDNWDEIEPDGTAKSNAITIASTDKYVLLRLPEGVRVVRNDDCSIKTFGDPRFVQLYDFTSEENYSLIFVEIVDPPSISLDGDILSVEYDAKDTEFYCLVVDGQEYGAITATFLGSATLNLKNFLSGQEEAGTYTIAVKAYNGSAYSMSNEVSYTFDGTILDKDKAYFIGLGGKDIEITYKIGPVDLTDYVQYWDIMDPDGTVQTPNGIGGLYGNEYILLYLPEGVTVSGYSNCEIKTFDDPRIIQLYNFSEAFAIVNFVA